VMVRDVFFMMNEPFRDEEYPSRWERF